MESIKISLAFGIFILVVGSLVYAETTGTLDSTVCCEQTLKGFYCQDVEATDCKADVRQPPTACSATQFCKLGWCYDSNEGICSPNTAQIECSTELGGAWSEEKPEACNLGCCLLDDQAAFVSLVRCKKLSGFYGLQTDWDSSITSEVSCILTAGSREEGACVYEEDFSRTCKFTTREVCKGDNVLGQGISDREESTVVEEDEDEGTGLTPVASTTEEEEEETDAGVSTAFLPLVRAQAEAVVEDIPAGCQSNGDGTFFCPGKLCTAPDLGTDCGRTEDTICVDGSEEVYFVDTCGNPANIYDSSKVNDMTYWTNIVKKSESCGAGASNENSASCGNCNYLLGSYCRAADDKRPAYGDNICASLNCEEEGRLHGESWCLDDGFNTGNPGSQYYRARCSNGEVITEVCATFRNEECIEDSSAGYSQAACRVNRWQDCTAQKEQEDCVNKDKRDCKWLDGIEYVLIGGMTNGTTTEANSIGAIKQAVEAQGGLKNLPKGACVPEIAPGFNHWDSEETQGICGQANAACPVKYEKGLLDDEWECVEHCDCLPGGELEKKRIELCMALGDCGPKTNYIGQKGSGPGYETKEEEQEDED